jgi:arsenate reductase
MSSGSGATGVAGQYPDHPGPTTRQAAGTTFAAMAAPTDRGVTIFHNPRCSKSRAAMEAIEGAGTDADVVRYLDAPPDRQTLEAIIGKLEDPVEALVRRGDARDKGIELPERLDADTVVGVLLEYPQLMERPVLVRGDRAIIGRPTDRVAPFLE